jgi:molecular chaperone GrpE
MMTPMNDSEDAFESEFVDEEEAELTPASVKRLREKLKKAVEEKQEYLDGWQRARADFANYKKEEASMHADKEERLKAQLIEELLPALDTLELSLRHDDSKNLRMIEKQFLDSLRRFGVERYGKKGDTFNPHLHEALAHEHDGHTVERVERSGYKIGNHIIRAAQVVI